MNPQFITTPSGDRLVVIPEALYQRMLDALDDHEDSEAALEFEASVRQGKEEPLPTPFADWIIEGQNKIKVWRRYRGITARVLAKRANLSASYLSQIEKGERDGSFDTIKKIAAALNIGVDDLA